MPVAAIASSMATKETIRDLQRKCRTVARSLVSEENRTVYTCRCCFFEKLTNEFRNTVTWSHENHSSVFVKATHTDYTHTHAHAHPHAHTPARTRTHAHARTHTHAHAHARTHTHAHAHARTRKSTHTHTHAHAKARTRKDTHIHVTYSQISAAFSFLDDVLAWVSPVFLPSQRQKEHHYHRLLVNSF